MNELKDYENEIDLELTTFVDEKTINKWLPYIGKDYNKEKILFVGLSHYDKKDNENWTKALLTKIPNIESVVGNGLGKYSNGEINENKLFRGLESVFFNLSKVELSSPDLKERRTKLWKSIAFHQLLEQPIDGETKHKETEKLRIEGLKKLSQLIDLLKPKHIVIMSNSWNYHADLAEIIESTENKINYVSVIPNKSDIRTVMFEKSKNNFSFSSIYHPSYFKYIDKQHKLLKDVMPEFIDYLNN